MLVDVSCWMSESILRIRSGFSPAYSSRHAPWKYVCLFGLLVAASIEIFCYIPQLALSAAYWLHLASEQKLDGAFTGCH